MNAQEALALVTGIRPPVKPVETTHRAEQELGPPITADGAVRWLSASALGKFDPNTEGGCQLRGWFHYRGSQIGLCEREPETPQMSAGTEMHKEIETHLRTGSMTLGPIALAGRSYIDQPGPGLSVEEPIILGGHGAITGVWLRVAGVPYAGHVDLYNHRGVSIDAEGDLRRDPPATLEVKDWKSTSDLKWAKNPEQVANAIPMTGYAMAGFKKWPAYERARLTHVYFQRGAKRGAYLATSLRERLGIERRWEYVEGIGRSVLDIAPETEQSKIPVNTKSCFSYQKKCPYFDACPRGQSASKQTTLEGSLGPRLAALLSGNIAAALAAPPNPYDDINIFEDTEENNMGLMKTVSTGAAAAAAAKTPEPEISLDDLIAEENQERAVINEPQLLAPIEGWGHAYATIVGSALGRPTLTGDAARMWCTDAGTDIFLTVAGDGKLAKMTISDPVKFIELGRQIDAKLANEAAKTAGPAKPAPAIAMLPADAPASNPVLAADPVEGLDTPKARELAAALAAKSAGVPASAPPQVPDAMVTHLTDKQVETIDRGAAAAPTEKPRRGRPPGAKNKPAVEPAPSDVVARFGDVECVPASGEPITTRTASEPDLKGIVFTRADTTRANAVSLYVNVAVRGVDLQPLQTIIEKASAELCKVWGCADIRLAANTTEGGYGKGSAVLVSALVAALAAGHIPPGNYYVRTDGNTLAAEVAAALESGCIASGGVVVWGIR